MGKLLDKGLIVIIGLICQLILKLLISLATDFTDSFGKFPKQLLLLRLTNTVELTELNSFGSRISSKSTTSIRRWYNVYMVSRHHFKVVLTSCLYCDNSYYLANCSTYNSPLCLRSNNIQSAIDFVRCSNVILIYLRKYNW